MEKYQRTLAELRTSSVLHWPTDILLEAGETSVLPVLLQTQEAFISLLKIANKDPSAWKNVLDSNTELTGPRFLKHLMVLTDLGGEALNKLPPLSNHFPDGIMRFTWNGKEHEYKFTVIQEKCALGNSSLKVDAKSLLKSNSLTAKMVDVAMLLMFGSTSTDDALPVEIKEKCCVGALMSAGADLDQFVRENYLRVSRQTGGATSNALGQLAQNFVVKRLKNALPATWEVIRNSTLPGVVHKDLGEGTNFDVVVKSPSAKYFGIEVSFQVTTNSTIERKARAAREMHAAVSKAGHKLCYVIGGAGNINIRVNASETLCTYSHCTVSLSAEEMRVLAEFFLRCEEPEGLGC
ncbi:hypothetical protein SAMN05216420_11088 [Nitrosospira sp. Nl5]|uniref:hypothetical protein n=1 Tax=Nitrosospira sp. Nl5 TaxID=200120 RepID=UPI00088BE3F1|nr:hypothetical protein [Nitrosospira sp. Nl5]SCY62443.1 hypothetical protein SAMN05216420_11088 [Nitrosospira sp. Nl5]